MLFLRFFTKVNKIFSMDVRVSLLTRLLSFKKKITKAFYFLLYEVYLF